MPVIDVHTHMFGRDCFDVLMNEGAPKYTKRIGVEGRVEMPDVPTIAQTIPGVGVNSWIGLMAPSGTRAATGPTSGRHRASESE